MTRQAAKHTRAIAVEGLGDVTVQGLPVEQLAFLYPAAQGEIPTNVWIEQLMVGEEVPDEAYLHKAFIRLIVGQSELTVPDVLGLLAADRKRLADAIYEAHPESRRLLRGLEMESV